MGPNATGVDFGVTKLFTVSGNVIIDPNINGIKDPGETNYTQTPSQLAYTTTILPLALFKPTPGTPFTSPDGTYTISQLVSGALDVFFTPPPPLPQWYMTSPLNGPPPRFNVTVGYNCDTNGAPGATCTGGNITDLDFGMVDNTPWFQSTCGDIRNDDGILDTVPNGYYANVTDPTCTTPGITFTGDTDASFGQGQNSTSNQEVGGFTYPELFSTTTQQPETAYTILLAKTQAAGIIPVNLTTVCQGGSLTPCTLDPALAHNVYLATSDVILNGFTFPAGQNYVILVHGNLTITGPITVPNGSTVIFSVSGNIIVDPTVGKAPTDATASLDGWYVAGQSFILPSAGNCNDLRLTIGGTVIVNSMGGGSFQNNRNLCRFNAVAPAVGFVQRLDMILNAPSFLKQQQTVSQELAP